MKKLCTAAVALLAMASAAEAARLVTPPVFAGSSYVECNVSYFGPTKNVAVTIAMVGNYGFQQTKVVKMGPNARAVRWAKECDLPGGDSSCQNGIACSFTFSVPTADVAGAVCDDVSFSGSRACLSAR